MSTVHFVGGEKGGVGKSVVARALAQLFIDRGLSFAALDADRSHGALVRYYADYAQRVDLEQLHSVDQILECALETDRLVLVDLPAQSQAALDRWMEATDIVSFAREAGIRLVFWHVTDGGFDSVSQLEQALSVPDSPLEYVVVKNLGRSKDFSQFDASPAHTRLLELGGRIITLPELDSSVMYKIDRFGSSFWAAINTSDGPKALPALERRRAKLWLERVHAALASGVDAQPSAVRESIVVPRQGEAVTQVDGDSGASVSAAN
jgi:hypothetical protein